MTSSKKYHTGIKSQFQSYRQMSIQPYLSFSTLSLLHSACSLSFSVSYFLVKVPSLLMVGRDIAPQIEPFSAVFLKES